METNVKRSEKGHKRKDHKLESFYQILKIFLLIYIKDFLKRNIMYKI